MFFQDKELVSPPFHQGRQGPRRQNVNPPLLEEALPCHCFKYRKPGPTPCLVGSDDHLQLPGILDDLFGQFRGGDGGIFWLLLLAGKAVVVVEAQNPPSLQEGKDDRWVG